MRNCPDYYRVPYREGRGGKFLTKEGYPGVKPPWGHLSAIDLNTGEVLWKQTIGDYPELKAKGIHAGSENFGAPVVTKGGLVFIAATRDEKIRAFDKKTGALLWEADLPAAGIATPGRLRSKRQRVHRDCLRRWWKTADEVGRPVRRLRAPGCRGRDKT